MAKTKKIADARRCLENPYAYLDGGGGYDALTPYVGLRPSSASSDDLSEYVPQRFLHLASAARDLQIRVWRHLRRSHPREALGELAAADPEIAAEVLGFDFQVVDGLGQNDDGVGRYEIAGSIDQHKKEIRISRHLSNSFHRFTAAHEVAHCALGHPVMMHRDRPLAGGEHEYKVHDPLERDANIFAGFFLMPPRVLARRIEQMFGSRVPLEFDTDLAFALQPSRVKQLLLDARDPAKRAMIIATATTFEGRQFVSLADQFGVSATAMAIQIERLGFVRKPV